MRTRELALAACASALIAQSAAASPIEYMLTIPTSTSAIESAVTLGGQTYVNDTVRFTFIGDDANVLSGCMPQSNGGGGCDPTYQVIYVGSASVAISSGSTVLKQATFLPNQIFVSHDQNNQGFGFGFLPTGIAAGGFAASNIQPLYPAGISGYAQFNTVPAPTDGNWTFNYHLTLASAASLASLSTPFPGITPTTPNPYLADGSASIFEAVYSCYNFGGSIYHGTCSSPATIATNLGSFSIGEIFEPVFTTDGPPAPLIGQFTAAPLLSVSTVPEPGTFGLMVLGFASIVVLCGRKRTSYGLHVRAPREMRVDCGEWGSSLAS
jgi:hypothetical protein